MILGEFMLEVTDIDIKKRMRFDNPWWDDETIVPSEFKQRRMYFDPLYQIVTDHSLRRAAVVMGPRRVGKTVMLRQMIGQLVDDGVNRKSILYLSLDNPIYQGLSLEVLYSFFKDSFDHDRDEILYIIFDEIQYLMDWEAHLKVLVDDPYSKSRFVVSGSAAAALKRKSRESGAGRFTDFILPPLTFYEYCEFKGFHIDDNQVDVSEMNEYFIKYLNYGGFPEIVFDESKEATLSQHLGQDIIDRVLLRDLPSLYGISDPVELNRLFRVLALNTGQEISLESLSQKSNVSKNTLKNYLEFLEAAFLIFRLDRVDQNAKIFKRATHFKVYLTNPSLRTALYGPMDEDSENFGALVETGYFAQIYQEHFGLSDFYARWDNKGAEVDHISLNLKTFKPDAAIEIKWSDRIVDHPSELKGLKKFVKNNPSLLEEKSTVMLLVKSRWQDLLIDDFKIEVMPVSLECYIHSMILGTGLKDGGENSLSRGFVLKPLFKEVLLIQ